MICLFEGLGSPAMLMDSPALLMGSPAILMVGPKVGAEALKWCLKIGLSVAHLSATVKRGWQNILKRGGSTWKIKTRPSGAIEHQSKHLNTYNAADVILNL